MKTCWGIKAHDGSLYRHSEKVATGEAIEAIMERRRQHERNKSHRRMTEREKWTVALARELGTGGMIR